MSFRALKRLIEDDVIKIDWAADPGKVFLQQLNEALGIDEDKVGLNILNQVPPQALQSKQAALQNYSYQVKVAFSLSEEILAVESDRLGTLKITIRDNKYIDLSFQDSDVQSRVSIDTPNRPQLKYIQSMLVAPILVPSFQNVLILGFGGGTLAKYYSDFYKNQQKFIVDLRPKLFELAQEYFFYSPDPNTAFIPGDASKALKKFRTRNQVFDIINTDIFIEGPVDLQLHEYFWEDISSCLSPKGVSVTNVWRGEYEDKYQKILGHHLKKFRTVFEVVNSDTEQVAMFGSQVPFELLMHTSLDIKSAEMSGLSGVNFKTHINNIRRIK